MKKNIFTYVVITGVFIYLMWYIVGMGNKIVRNSSPDIAQNSKSANTLSPIISNTDHSLFHHFLNNVKNPFSLLILQVLVILIASRIFGIMAKRLGQQTVIGEILAGIILGPSLLGWLFPQFSGFIFPPESMVSLQFLSQIGLLFFMFVIGMELDLSQNNKQNAVIISHAGIVFPYFLGMGLSYFIYKQYAPLNVNFISFSLFMGIAMSITAFPVLARILKERGLSKTPLGILVIACAAADDATAWCLLALVIAIAKAGSLYNSVFTIGLTVAYVIFMIYLLKPWLKKLSANHVNKEKIDRSIVAISFFILLLSAYFTEIIGIHALFGAFMAGVIMPNNIRFKEFITNKIEDVSTVLLLPIFFAYTGLRTQIGLLNDSHLWFLCGLIIFIAVLGKFGGSAITARLIGRSWKESLSIGALMNTRGLMELVVLNMGYDLGILSPEIFTIMVIMAISTTLMTGPFLDLINYCYRKKLLKEGS